MKRLVVGIGCVELGVTDLQFCADFYERIWGLRPVARTADAVYLRGQSALHHILVLRRATEPAIHRLVFHAADAEALHELHARIMAGGYPISHRPRRLETPGGGLGFDSRDPEGRNFTFACDVANDVTSTASVPDRMTKITHLNLNSGAYEDMRTYMAKVLGFRVIDETRVNGFFNCNNDHHSIVIGRRDAPTLNHVAFEMPDLDSTMRMAGTMREAGYPIEWGVGRHGPGNNVFAYFAGPEEMPIECTSEVLQVDETYRYRGPDQWSFPAGRTDQWGVTGPPSARIKRIQNMFRFPELPLR